MGLENTMGQDVPGQATGAPRLLFAAVAVLTVAACGPLSHVHTLPEDRASAGAKPLCQARGLPADHCLESHRTSDARAGLSRLTEAELKALYIACSRDALHYHMNAAEAAACSIVYEALLQHVFGGDFHALLKWSRSQRDGATEKRTDD